MSTPDSGLEMEGKRAHIEKLGRERPAKFKTALAEILFCYSVIASQFMAVRPPPFDFEATGTDLRS